MRARSAGLGSSVQRGERIDLGDQRLDALKAAPKGLRLLSGQHLLGGRAHELRSGLDEPVGVVVKGLAAGVVVLGRGAAVVGAPADRKGLLELGWFLVTAGEGCMPPERGCLAGVVVRPDAVEVVAQAARTAR